jgi:hypothetical protein
VDAATQRKRGLVLVGAAALALNVAGVTWGLPARWHPDEKGDAVARMARVPTLAPESFINPSLPLYATLPFAWVQHKLSGFGSLHGLRGDATLLARLLSALAAAAAVVVLGRAAGRHAGFLALPAAAALALAPGVVNLAHFATPEAWVLALAALVLLAAARVALGQSSPAVLGLVLGLAGATKYTAAALLPVALAAVAARPGAAEPAARWPVALTGALAAAGGLGLRLGAEGVAARLFLPDARLLHAASALAFVRGLANVLMAAGLVAAALVLVARRGRPARLAPVARALSHPAVLALVAAAAAGFLLGTPWALVEPWRFLSDLAYNQQTRAEYKGLVGASTSFGADLGLAADALTVPLLAAALAGAVVAGARARGGDRLALLPLLAALGPYLLVASSGHRALRFLAPALPGAAWLAALALASIPRPTLRRVATGAVLARAALASLLVVRLFHVDSRRLATRWIADHVPPRETIDLIANNPGYAPSVPPGRTLRVVPTLSREMAPIERFREAAARYPEESADWLILTASFYERFLEHPDQQPERAAFFRALLEGRGGFEPVARFRQPAWLRPDVEFVDPEIVVLRRKGGAGTPQ